jgi:hypothetical protein
MVGAKLPLLAERLTMTILIVPATAQTAFISHSKNIKTEIKLNTIKNLRALCRML